MTPRKFCFRARLSVSFAWMLLTCCLTSAEVSPDGLSGTLVICGGGPSPAAALDLFSSTAGTDGSVVVIAQASTDPMSSAAKASEWLKSGGITNVVVPKLADDGSVNLTNLVEDLSAARGVWICGGQQQRLANAIPATVIESALKELLQRGGVIGGTSAGAAIMSQVMIASGTDVPQMSRGWDLLPDAIIDQHATERRRLPRTRLAVESHKDHFGLAIDKSTAVIVSGRSLKIAGNGNVAVLLAGNKIRKAETQVLADGDTLDLTQLRRAAQLRHSEFDPGELRHGETKVSSGALVVVGGGSMPKDVVDRFVELAGGKEARIVVLPTAVSREAAAREGIPGFLKRSEVADVTVLRQRESSEVSEPEFQSAMKAATGVWFGGGRQWNFVDAYENTEAIELFRDVLRRGGVIGGSSAGATIQGELLVRGHPLGNTVMLAEGYEQGFAFLPGTAIDQHFSQRGRQPDLISVIRRHPKMIGVGLDEGTAIIVRGTQIDVLGLHSAHFLTAARLNSESTDALDLSKPKDAARVYVSVESGSSLDLQTLEQ